VPALDEQPRRERARGERERQVDDDLARRQEVGRDEHRPEEERRRRPDRLAERGDDGDGEDPPGRHRVQDRTGHPAPHQEERGDQRARQSADQQRAVIGRIGIRREGDEAQRHRPRAEQRRTRVGEPLLRRRAVPVVDRAGGIDDARRTERHRSR
jgi:hypothetical protein